MSFMKNYISNLVTASDGPGAISGDDDFADEDTIKDWRDGNPAGAVGGGTVEGARGYGVDPFQAEYSQADPILVNSSLGVHPMYNNVYAANGFIEGAKAVGRKVGNYFKQPGLWERGMRTLGVSNPSKLKRGAEFIGRHPKKFVAAGAAGAGVAGKTAYDRYRNRGKKRNRVRSNLLYNVNNIFATEGEKAAADGAKAAAGELGWMAKNPWKTAGLGVAGGAAVAGLGGYLLGKSHGRSNAIDEMQAAAMNPIASGLDYNSITAAELYAANDVYSMDLTDYSNDVIAHLMYAIQAGSGEDMEDAAEATLDAAAAHESAAAEAASMIGSGAGDPEAYAAISDYHAKKADKLEDAATEVLSALYYS